MTEVTDVLVAGGGPAGRALAGACARLGLRTALLDPGPDRPWRSTYAAWSAELPPLPRSAVAATVRGRAIAVGPHDLGWDYTVLDTVGLRAHLDDGLAGVAVHRGRLGSGPDDGRVVLASGRDARPGGHPDAGGEPASEPREIILASGETVRARIVVDATGHPPPRGRRTAAEQTAVGVVVEADLARTLVGPGEALFMDWRRHHGRGGWPTFLYAVPLGGDRVLVEETSLARRPGLPLAELRLRLRARLSHHGVSLPADTQEERVRFPVDAPRGGRREWTLRFGAAAPLVHPATGFSIASSLALAPRLAEALSGADPLRAARRTVWPPSALAVHALRRRGLEALLRMPAGEVPAFFEVFLGLPEAQRWAYLTGRTDLAGTAAAMRALWSRSGWGMRARLVGPALLPQARPLTTG